MEGYLTCDMVTMVCRGDHLCHGGTWRQSLQGTGRAWGGWQEPRPGGRGPNMQKGVSQVRLVTKPNPRTVQGSRAVRRGKGYDPQDERYYVSDTNTGAGTLVVEDRQTMMVGGCMCV